MDSKNLYGGFSDEADKIYEDEAKKRWGDTFEYKQSNERIKDMSKEDLARIQKDNDELYKEISSNISKGPKSPEVQALIQKHYDGLRAFYEPNIELYHALGGLYVEDERFAEFFKRYHSGMPQFMKEAMQEYCNTHK